MGCCQIQNQTEPKSHKIDNDDLLSENHFDDISKNMISFEEDNKDKINLEKMLNKINSIRLKQKSISKKSKLIEKL